MDEEANSWIRRAKFSHTVCHRLDSSRLSSIPIRTTDRGLSSSPGLKSRHMVSSSPSSSSSLHRDAIRSSESSPNPKSKPKPATPKRRSLSPHPESKLSDTFQEAKSERRRSTTPQPRRSTFERGMRPKKWSGSTSSLSTMGNGGAGAGSSPLRHLASGLARSRKYFDGGSGRVSAVAEEECEGCSVDMSKLFLGNKFAHGAHSRLYHGMYNGSPVAVKIISAPDGHDSFVSMSARLEREFVTEVSLLSRLRHPHVIKLVGACRNSPVFCIVTEFLAEGSLRSYMHKRGREPVPLGRLIKAALDVARGMEFVHSRGVIHRDLKPENVLIQDGFRMKVADFGTACDEACCDFLADDTGTYRWMAPEMIRHRPYGRKVDVYSFALVLWEMAAGTVPYDHMTPIQAAFAVVNKNLRPTIPTSCAPAMRALIEQCWSVQPEKRPEFWQVVKVLEEFDASFERDGTLNLAQAFPACQDHKKGLFHWIQKLSPVHPNSTPVPKPKFI